MWRNYITVGVRALTKNRTYALINILGLAIGIAACLLILGFVRYEFSYDAWLPGSQNVFQFQSRYQATAQGGEEMKLQQTSYIAGQALKKDFPQAQVVYVTSERIVVIKDGQSSTIGGSFFTDGPLFDVIQMPFVAGDPRHALDDPHAVVLSEKSATKLFGSEPALGKTITLVSGNIKADYRVTGIFKDLPKNTNLNFGLVARFNPQDYWRDSPAAYQSWNDQEGSYWVRLKDPAEAARIEAQFPAWEKRNIPDDVDGTQKSNPGDYQDWKLVNIRDLHLGEAQNGAQRPGNDPRTILTFAIIAALILAMACVNFTNLATARASQRAREVALRKVLGATRGQLMMQFLGESILLTAVAMLVALSIVELVLPGLNAFLDAQIRISWFALDGLILPVIALTLIVGLAGGLYPAFVLSRFQPARVLKANKSAADAEGSGRLRNILVVGQFAVSIGLIICTAVVYSQTVYARTADAGFQRDGLIQVDNIGRPQAEQVATTLLEQIKRLPGVTAVAQTQVTVDNGRNSITEVQLPNSTNRVALGVYAVDQGFPEAMGMKLLAGRFLSDTNAMDDATIDPTRPESQQALVRRGANIVLSESAAQRVGYKRPADAIGKSLGISMVDTQYGLVPGTIVGVVSDARFRSVRDPLQPIMYYHQTGGYSQMMVRYKDAAPKQVFEQVGAVWKKLVPEIPFGARHVDDIVRDLYDADEARAQLFGAFAILAVIVACLGLFGLAAFTAERRTKEIGIRKVLGARTRDIVRLLVWQFSKPVVIANLIAWPVAWWVMRDWLNHFDLRIDLGPAPFILAGGVALLIAIATIGTHAWRVARANPITALRYE